MEEIEFYFDNNPETLACWLSLVAAVVLCIIIMCLTWKKISRTHYAFGYLKRTPAMRRAALAILVIMLGWIASYTVVVNVLREKEVKIATVGKDMKYTHICTWPWSTDNTRELGPGSHIANASDKVLIYWKPGKVGTEAIAVIAPGEVADVDNLPSVFVYDTDTYRRFGAPFRTDDFIISTEDAYKTLTR